MGELESGMAAERAAAKAAADGPNGFAARAARGKQLIEEFVAAMRKHCVPPTPVWQCDESRKESAGLMGRKRTTVQSYRIVGEGWPLESSNDSAYAIAGHGIAVVRIGEVPAARTEWVGIEHDYKRNRDYKTYYETVFTLPAPVGRQMLTAVEIHDAPSQYVVWADRSSLLARQANYLIDKNR